MSQRVHEPLPLPLDDYLTALETVTKNPEPVEAVYRRRIADARLDGDSRLVRDLERALATHQRSRLRSVATVKSLRHRREKPRHPSLLEQIEAIEQAMNASSDAGTFYRLLAQRSKLLSIAQTEHGHERVTAGAREPAGEISEPQGGVTVVVDRSADLLGTGHCSAKTISESAAKRENADRIPFRSGDLATLTGGTDG